MSSHTRDYITVNPGPQSADIKRADAKRILLSAIATELEETGWQDATPYLSRAERTDIITKHPGEQQDLQALVIDGNTYKELQLAEKLEAGLIMAGTLQRTGTAHVFNASVIYPPGPCVILANKEGRAQLKYFIEQTQRREVSASVKR